MTVVRLPFALLAAALLACAGFLSAETSVSSGAVPVAVSSAAADIDVKPPAAEGSDEPAVHFVPIENTAFTSGEKFQYTIKYQFITAGTATLEVLEGPLVKGVETYQFTSTARSTKFIDKFFRVRDFNSSIVNKDSLATLTFHQNLKEGHYHVMRTTQFDYDAGVFRYERHYKGKTTTREGELTEPATDILGAFFYTRSLPLELGKDYRIRVFGDKKVYSLLVKVAPKLETVKVPAGNFECIRVEPFIVGDAIFKLEGGRMSLYLTNDRRRMPVLIRSKVTLGAFDAELTDYVLPTLPAASKP